MVGKPQSLAPLWFLLFGMGAVGLFVSAVVKRTQTATVVTFVLVLFGIVKLVTT